MLVTAATAQGSVVAWWSGPDGSVTAPLPSNSYREKETEKMFKVGDVVKCIAPPYGPSHLTKGKTYVVQTAHGGYPSSRMKNLLVTVIGDDGGKGSFFATRFELVDPVTSMSDQQLADDFRTAHRKVLSIFDELTKRGYKVTVTFGKVSKVTARRFSKSGDFPEVKIEKEKKEVISL
jgi:hypothetical protein